MKLLRFVMPLFFFWNTILFSDQVESIQLPLDTLTIAFGGDIHFVWGISELQKKEGLTSPVTKILPFFSRFDFRALNIETVISYNGKSKNKKNYVFQSDPENLQVLKELKLNLAILGNNHTYDLKDEGLKEMLDWFKKYEIPTIGAGLNLQESIKPYIAEIKNIKLAFFSVSLINPKEDYADVNKPGIANLNPMLLQEISKTQKSVDYIFLSIHWGQEYNPFISKEQKNLTQQLFKRGVNFIVGHHPHIPQGIEVYSNSAVVYSLGNFLFGSAHYLQDENIVTVFHFDPNTKKFLGIEIYPITGRYRKYGYKLDEPNEDDKDKLFKELYYLSKKENPQQNIFISKNRKSLFIKALD